MLEVGLCDTQIPVPGAETGAETGAELRKDTGAKTGGTNVVVGAISVVVETLDLVSNFDFSGGKRLEPPLDLVCGRWRWTWWG